MFVLTSLDAYKPDPAKPLMLAVGNFDGLHLAHQALLGSVLKSARKQQGTAAALTFSQHPQHILHPSSKPPLLTSSDHKLMLLEDFGLDLCFHLPFTSEFARIEPENFVRDILKNKLKVSEVYLGHNARFGRERRGDSALMKQLSEESGFFYQELSPVQVEGENVSSSRIREHVRDGRLDEAALCLGRRFSVLGRVVHGSGRGAELGFATANLEIASEILPPLGVYPVLLREVSIQKEGIGHGTDFRAEQGAVYKGVLNYGYRPTFEDGKTAVPEVHVLDFKGDMYGKMLEVAFFTRLRAERSFSNIEALKEQINADILSARKMLEGA